MTNSSPLRVLHVITDLGVGGAESMLTSLLTGGVTEEIETHIISLMPSGSNRDIIRAAGHDVLDLGMARSWPSPSGIIALAGRIRALRPDVVQSWMYHADLIATAALSLLSSRRRPHLVWGVRCSNMDARAYGWRLRTVISLCARLSRRPAAVIANSHAGRAAHEALGYRPVRFDVIPNGIDIDRYKPDATARAEVRAQLRIGEDVPLLAHLARIDPMKDHETFLAALERLPGVAALAIGKGTEELAPRPNLHRLGLRHDIPRLLAAADFIVSSSAFGEGFSNALAEAMAAGLPAVATDVGDSGLIVGDTGVVVPPRDSAALAAAVERLLVEPPQRHDARCRDARRRIETEFPLTRTAEAYAAFYRTLVH